MQKDRKYVIILLLVFICLLIIGCDSEVTQESHNVSPSSWLIGNWYYFTTSATASETWTFENHGIYEDSFTLVNDNDSTGDWSESAGNGSYTLVHTTSNPTSTYTYIFTQLDDTHISERYVHGTTDNTTYYTNTIPSFTYPSWIEGTWAQTSYGITTNSFAFNNNGIVRAKYGITDYNFRMHANSANITQSSSSTEYVVTITSLIGASLIRYTFTKVNDTHITISLLYNGAITSGTFTKRS